VLRGRTGSLVLCAFPAVPDGSPGAWEWHQERLPLDVDVAADSAPGQPALSDRHLTLTPPGRPAQARALFVLFPVQAGREGSVRLSWPAASVLRIAHDGGCDEIDLEAVWQSDLRAAFRAGGEEAA
jgi:hypothetical protein